MALNTSYIITLLTIGAIYAIAASSLNIVTGYTGLVSLGHAAFLAMGAYTEAILTANMGVPFLLAFPASIIAGAILGVGLGLPSLRVNDDFLAVTTIGINFIVLAILRAWDFVGGTLGVGDIPAPQVAGFTIEGLSLLALSLAMLGITMVSIWWLQQSWAGLALAALRDDEQAAEAISISTARFKIIAFGLSGAFAGIAGALYAHYFGFITPTNFGFLVSIDILIFAVFGGLRTVWGPVVGAYFLYLLPELFRVVAEYRIVLYGLLLMIIIILEPDGLMGLYKRLSERTGTTERNPTERGEVYE